MNASPNWIEIERLYRAGQLSVRTIATSQGITHASICKRAKRAGWKRDVAMGVIDGFSAEQAMIAEAAGLLIRAQRALSALPPHAQRTAKALAAKQIKEPTKKGGAL